MLKHIEQSVAASALRWFGLHRDGLAAYYAPQMEVDPPFRVRFTTTHDNWQTILAHVEGGPDSERWSDDVYFAAFLAVTCFKQALNAVGPSMLKQAHTRLKHDPYRQQRVVKLKPKKRPAHHRDFSVARRAARSHNRKTAKRKAAKRGQ